MASSDESDDDDSLREGDLVLRLDNSLLYDLSVLQDTRSKNAVHANIIRNGKQYSLTVPTLEAAELSTLDIIEFGGLTIQKPHLAIRQQIGKLPSEVYISYCRPGSPGDFG